MKLLKTLSLAAAISGVLVVSAPAQNNSARTITNADLEKYRQARIKSDEEYRQNYEKLGLPSPEELERREAEREKRLSEFSLQLQAERRQQEYFKALAAAQAEPQIIYLNSQGNYQSGFYPLGYTPFIFGGNRLRLGSKGNFGPNVQMVRDQANMFPGAFGNRNNFRRGILRTGPGRPGPRGILSPRR